MPLLYYEGTGQSFYRCLIYCPIFVTSTKQALYANNFSQYACYTVTVESLYWGWWYNVIHTYIHTYIHTHMVVQTHYTV